MTRKILIEHGVVVDGSGNPGKPLDVLVEDDRITDVGASLGSTTPLKKDPQVEVIDATGKIVCPGFIDMHAHSDFAITVDGSMAPKLRQGFTSVVIGSCGFSAAPNNPRMRRHFRRFATGMFGDEFAFDWRTMGEYLDVLRARRVGANVVAQVGFGSLRLMARGMRPGRPTPGQLGQMKRQLAQALDEGARGFSTGLIYPPQRFSQPDEVTELCRVAAGRGALYTTHIRNERDRLEEAVDEAIETARQTGISLQISHHKAVLERNWGKPKKTLASIERARAEGFDIAVDAYPYDGLSNLFLSLLFQREPRLENKIIFLHLKRFPQYQGRTLADVMADTGKSLRGAAAMLLLREGLFKIPIIGRMMSEDDVRTVLAHPLTSIGSDGVESFGRTTHPRLFGTTVRFLEKYVLGEKLVSLEEGIRKMTSLPAAKARIDRRGLVKAGYFADLVVFDPKRLHDRSDYVNTNEHPVGFDAVIVNGRVAVREDRLTDERAGVVL